MAIKYRQELGRPLTYAEGDENFRTLEDSIEKTLAEYPTLTAAMADDIPDGVVFIVNDGDDAGYWRRDSSNTEGAEFLRDIPKNVTVDEVTDEINERNLFLEKDILERKPNLFNGNFDFGYIFPDEGIFHEGTTWVTTDYIRVVPGRTYYGSEYRINDDVRGAFRGHVTFFDENKEHIPSEREFVNSVTIPEGVRFIRWSRSIGEGGITISDVVIADSTEVTYPNYAPYGYEKKFDLRSISLQNTTARYAFDTLQEAKELWASLTSDEKAELEGRSFIVSAEKQAYKWDSSNPEGVSPTEDPALFVNKEDLDERVSNLVDKDIFLRTPNLYNGVNYRGYIHSSTGEFVPGSRWFLTDFIPVEEGKTYGAYHYKPQGYRGSMEGYISVFDENKEPILIEPNIQGHQIEIPVGEGWEYVRWSYYMGSGEVPPEDVMIGDESEFHFSEYEPYGYTNTVDLGKTRIGLSKTGKVYAAFGDSITDFQNYPERIGVLLGCTSYNFGFGGCRMAEHPEPYDAFSMYRLADAIASGDWTLQQNAAQELAQDYSYDRIEKVNQLAATDFSQVDIMSIFYGTNDFTGVPIGTNSDTTGETFKGAINHSITTILTAHPHIKLCFFTLKYKKWRDEGLDYDTKTNSLGLKQKDYSDAIKEICHIHHIPVFDSEDLGINSINETYYFTDGTHLNDNGAELLANHFADFLQRF